MLATTQSIGAPRVLFAKEEDSQLGRTFDFTSFCHTRLKIIGVEIRGMEAETGDVVFGAKAWNSEPLLESERIVEDLTTFGLQKAWNEQDRSLPLPVGGGRTNPEQEKVIVVTSYSEVVLLASEDPQSEIGEPLLSEEEPSLGLPVASEALSLLYTPVKIVYAGLGGFMGGVIYLLTAGNEQAAQSVWDASLNGTYWLKTKHLQGEEVIHFKGEPSQIDPIHQARVDGDVGAVANSFVSLPRGPTKTFEILSEEHFRPAFHPASSNTKFQRLHRR